MKMLKKKQQHLFEMCMFWKNVLIQISDLFYALWLNTIINFFKKKDFSVPKHLNRSADSSKNALKILLFRSSQNDTKKQIHWLKKMVLQN